MSTLTVLRLGEKAASSYIVSIPLPRGQVELKSYVKVHPAGLSLSAEEFEYAKNYGLENMVKKGLVEIADTSKPFVAPVKAPEVKKVEDPMKPKTSIQTIVEKEIKEAPKDAPPKKKGFLTPVTETTTEI